MGSARNVFRFHFLAIATPAVVQYLTVFTNLKDEKNRSASRNTIFSTDTRMKSAYASFMEMN
jgi:hypothetical protein